MPALSELFSNARAQRIPVIRDDSAKLLREYVESHRPAKILEIGTAVGCSGILMLTASPNAELVTVEIDPDRFEQAKQNFAAFGVSHRVRQILDDCTAVVRYLESKFDLIFLDGPKAQYPDMLPYLIPLIRENGALFADDVSFFGAVDGTDMPPHKNRTIILELRRFKQMLLSDDHFDVTCYDTTDGTMIAVKKYE